METQKPSPLASITASSARITSKHFNRLTVATESWQEDSWDMYGLVGEQRFLATTLAGRMGQAKLFAAKLNDDPMDPPTPIEDGVAADALTAFGGSAVGRAQIITRMGVNLFVAGDGYLVGIPKERLGISVPHKGTSVDDSTPSFLPDGLRLEDIEWKMMSVDEVNAKATGEITLKVGRDETIEGSPDDFIICRVWRPHPRRSWEAESPTRSSLPVLRELVGLTMHISAQVDSRLAGAGLLLVPQSAAQAIRNAAGLTDEDLEDPFIEALMEAMLAPMRDRDNASAVVPLTATVPDETAALFRHISFSSELSTAAKELRDEAIRRLALGQDAPPELLLGTSGMNHWGSWLVREDVVTTHVEPPLALICDALTTQYLWPILEEQGMSPEEAQEYVIWYDVSHMILRPNRTQDAMVLHTAGAISDDSLRESANFNDDDAPNVSAYKVALDMIEKFPALLTSPGVNELVAQITSLLEEKEYDEPEPEPVPPGLEQDGDGETDPQKEVDEEMPEGSPEGPPPDSPLSHLHFNTDGGMIVSNEDPSKRISPDDQREMVGRKRAGRGFTKSRPDGTFIP